MTNTKNMTLPNLSDYYDKKLPDSAIVSVPNGLLKKNDNRDTEMLALADKVGKDLACTRTHSMREWAVIENALRASLPNQAGNPSRELPENVDERRI